MEINTYFGRCRCCLTYGYLKNMWEEHYKDGQKEIYIDMLVECFALSWGPSKESSELDQICETCVTKLRDAYNFKKTILESQFQLFDRIDEVKIKNVDLAECGKDDESRNPVGISLCVKKSDAQFEEPEDPKEMDYEDVEYLEDEDYKETVLPQQSQHIIHPKNNNINPNSTKKLQTRLPRTDQYKNYKKYTSEDLQTCLKAVRNEGLTPREASEKFKIPRRTIAAKMKMDPEELENQSEDRRVTEEKRIQLIKELKSLLTYTNAMLYKSHNSGYSCAYCTNSQYYDNPDDLRNHTKTKHDDVKIEKIDFTMRPYWMHEIVKLDIHNLECNKCTLPICDWNDMFKHLKDKHGVILDQAYTRVIPYDLTEELKCALCKQDFTFYNQLDAHMNAHYNNYVCFDCGDTFVSEVRLKRHMKTHNGKYACSMCQKVFASLKEKTNHEESIHKLRPKFKCRHCGECFSKEYLLHIHLLSKHKESVDSMSCEVCGKEFTWRPSYVKHKKKHKTCKMFECEMCEWKCFSKIKLRDHLLKHSGERRFSCNICNNKYINLYSLKRHIRRRHRDGQT